MMNSQTELVLAQCLIIDYDMALALAFALARNVEKHNQENYIKENSHENGVFTRQ